MRDADVALEAWRRRREFSPADTIDRHLKAEGLAPPPDYYAGNGRAPGARDYRERFRRIEKEYVELFRASPNDDDVEEPLWVTCQGCGEDFPVRFPSEVERRKFCNPDCYYTNAATPGSAKDIVERNYQIVHEFRAMTEGGISATEVSRAVGKKYNLHHSHIRHIIRQYRKGLAWARG